MSYSLRHTHFIGVSSHAPGISHVPIIHDTEICLYLVSNATEEIHFAKPSCLVLHFNDRMHADPSSAGYCLSIRGTVPDNHVAAIYTNTVPANVFSALGTC
jgi:hypothetical protein